MIACSLSAPLARSLSRSISTSSEGQHWPESSSRSLHFFLLTSKNYPSVQVATVLLSYVDYCVNIVVSDLYAHSQTSFSIPGQVQSSGSSVYCGLIEVTLTPVMTPITTRKARVQYVQYSIAANDARTLHHRSLIKWIHLEQMTHTISPSNHHGHTTRTPHKTESLAGRPQRPAQGRRRAQRAGGRAHETGQGRRLN